MNGPQRSTVWTVMVAELRSYPPSAYFTAGENPRKPLTPLLFIPFVSNSIMLNQIIDPTKNN